MVTTRSGRTTHTTTTTRRSPKRRMVRKKKNAIPKTLSGLVKVLDKKLGETKYHELEVGMTKEGLVRTVASTLLGANIVTGDLRSNREGIKINLMSVNIRGFFQHQYNPTTTENQFKVPIFVTVLIVSTKRDDDPLTYMFRNINNNTPVAYGTVATANTAQGDQIRETAALNTEDIRILKRRRITVRPPGINDPSVYTTRSLYMNVKINKTLTYSVGQTASIPIPSAQIKPNIWCIYYVTQNNSIVTDDTLEMLGTMRIVCKYKDI